MKILIATLIFLSGFYAEAAIPLAQYKNKPKLILLIVVDQFRADFFTRLEKKFLPAGTEKTPGGFQFLLSRGAYYPLAEYKVLAAMTCPGHAMISTGSQPSAMGISLNEWYDRDLKRTVGCVEDEKHGVSPWRLTNSTVGDELKIISPNSKIISIAVKDRSAVMLGGHHANYAFWLDQKGWQTSTYYAPQNPFWVDEFNKSISGADLKSLSATPKGVEWTSELAIKALETEKLGTDEATDILALSFSTHDIAGHKFGNFSSQVEAITLAEDKEISKLLKKVQSQLGSLNEVVVVLTGDHGIPPTVEEARLAKIPSGRIDGLDFYQKVASRLNKKFGKPRGPWIAAGVSMNYYISADALSERKASKEDVEAEIKLVAQSMNGVFAVFTSTEIRKGFSLPSFFNLHIANQFNPITSGDVIVLPEPFFMGKGEVLVNHITGYSYDRYVPLVIYGHKIKPGVYAESAEVIDVAPTLSFILGQLPPAKSAGRVLKEIF